jgi:hypothetical protein
MTTGAMTDDVRQQRQAPRLAANLKVSYSCAGQWGSCYSLDLSMKGMFLQLTEPMQPGELMGLSFHVGVDGERQSVQCVCHILRVLDLEKARSYGLLPGVAVEYRGFLQGREHLRAYLAARLQLPPEQLGEALSPDEPSAQELDLIRQAANPPPAPAAEAPQAPAAPVQAAVLVPPQPERPRAFQQYSEPPPKARRSHAASPSPSAGVEPHPAVTSHDWSRQDWENYFATMRRQVWRHQVDRDVEEMEAERRRPDVRRLVAIGATAALLATAFFLLLHIIVRLLYAR